MSDLTLVQIQSQINSQEARAQAAATKLQATIPVTALSAEAQEAFLLSLSDLKLLEHLLETARSTLNAAVLETSQPAPDNDDGFLSSLSGLLEQLCETIFKQFGVRKDLILPTVIKDLARQAELIETVLHRCEQSVALVQGV